MQSILPRLSDFDMRSYLVHTYTFPLLRALTCPVHPNHGSLERLFSLDEIVYSCNDNNGRSDNDTPVHRLQTRMWLGWEENEHEGDTEETESQPVDDIAQDRRIAKVGVWKRNGAATSVHHDRDCGKVRE